MIKLPPASIGFVEKSFCDTSFEAHKAKPATPKAAALAAGAYAVVTGGCAAAALVRAVCS